MPQEISEQDMSTCLDVLQRLADSHGTLPRGDRLKGLISKLYREGRRWDAQADRKRKEGEDRALKATTVMVQVQRDAVAAAAALPPASGEAVRVLNEPETCYICKQQFREVHFFYHLLCPKCAAYNYHMRELSADLTGRVALVTGGRVKIGHQTVLRLLRDGAKVIVTTRFPQIAAKRLHAEPDSARWLHRVEIYGLDLRNIPAVEAFAHYMLDNEPHLDILIHNAAQTIRRPAGFYGELVAQEAQPVSLLPEGVRELVKQDASMSLTRSLTGAAGLPAIRDVLPVDLLADHEERADSRNVNSWLLRLDEVSAPEMVEVQLVNSIAPFLLNSRLKPLLMRSPHERRFIVNVSAMEGQFSRHKTVFHPHTNMAKAALNMMTRTSGEDYAKDGIYMTSVDTGWVTDENPTPKRERGQQERAFFPPLDIIDGMARIYHPVAHGITQPEEPFYGVFLKDFSPCPW